MDQFNLLTWAQTNDYDIVGQAILPARKETRVPLPKGFSAPIYKEILEALGIPDGLVWRHQAEALEAVDEGFSNAVVSTATASGKSLIFQLASIHKILSHPEAGHRALVFYPTLALNNDQHQSWKKIFEAAKFDPSHLAVIDGSVPVADREAILKHAKVALMTPDVVHAWLMGNLRSEAVQGFLRGLALKTLDEAHIYDGVFGSYMSYLLKRVAFAQAVLNPHYREGFHDQIIMATATLPEPREFAMSLTGKDAWVIGPEFDTSPQYERSVYLIRTPDKRRNTAMRLLVNNLAAQEESGGMLTFAASRVKANELTDDGNAYLRKLGSKFRLAAHMGGFDKTYRQDLEQEFREGKVKGLIATPTLDVGVDFANVKTIVIDGLPENPGRFRQRFGRIRKGGTCYIIEERSNLQRQGTVLDEYLRREAYQPILYLVNKKIQAEQAQCLLDEMDALDVVDVEEYAKAVSWPRGFVDTLRDLA
ncbi:MAG TPA: DEAD/DEAH box helicase, partial [Alphaproteobacteria bacterium]